MAWFEAHETMARHPKTLKLSRLLNISRREAIGLLYDLFSWGINVAGKYGELPGLVQEDIAQALDYTPKQAGKVVGALVESGYLNQSGGVYCIHDWYDYAGKLYDKRESDRLRKSAERSRKSNGLP